jgi:peptidoglycan/xylan/chitin deacetylase (PgdA/CDA1 family)
LGLKGSRRLWFLLVLLLAAGIAAYFTLNSEGPFQTPTVFPVVLEPSLTPQMTAGITPVSTVSEASALTSAVSVEAVGSTVNAQAELPDSSFVVLCYHRFVSHPEKFTEKLSEYRFPQAEFQWQMQYLKDHGITPISMKQLKDYWFDGKPLPARPVLLTFDDGFRSLYDVMFPVLQKFKYPGVLFLYTDFIRDQGDSLPLEDIRVMQKYGMELESHTKSHFNLGYIEEKTKADDFSILLEKELSDPLEYIEKEFDYTPTTLAYPYGVYDDRIVEETQKLKYQLAFTVNPGPNDRTVPPLKLKRDLILNPISHEAFAALFETKVLHLENVQPDDGEFILTHRPLISMIIQDDVDYKTIKLYIGTAPVSYSYDPKTHVLKHQLKKPLKSGGHFISVEAVDKFGQPRNYTLYFRIKHSGLVLAPSKEEKLTGTDDK